VRRPLEQIVDFDDGALLRLVVARRADAFDELYRRHAAAVSAFASRVCADRSVSDDLTQQTFLALWTRASSIAGVGHSIRPWLLTVVRNAAVDRQRRIRPSLELDPKSDRAAESAGPAEVAMQNQLERDIRRALDALATDQRAVIELAYFGGLTQTQIAEVLDTPLGTVKSRVRLAMQHLRRSVDAFGMEALS